MDFTSISAGTDLASAYSQPDLFDAHVSSSTDKHQQAVRPVEYSTEIPEAKADISTARHTKVHQEGQGQGQGQGQAHLYNQSEFLEDMNQNNLKDQMNVLRKEMAEQKNANKLQYKENYIRNSMYDRVLKTTNDVFRFICLAMIIIFALAFHEIISKTLNRYIDSINVSPKREFAMQMSYPVAILLLYWTLKSMR